MAISFALSIAALAIQREVASGANVPCWLTVTAPLGSRISYQRNATRLPLATAWFTTTRSWLANFRYAMRYISRSPRVSSVCVVPFCGTQVPPLPQARLELATLIAIGLERPTLLAAKSKANLRRNNWPGLLFCQVKNNPGPL